MSEPKKADLIVGDGVVVQLSTDLRVDGEIHLEGELVGNVHCDRIHIGPTGKLIGHLHAGYADVHGEVSDHVKSDRLVLRETCRVTGHIEYTTVEIEPGASLHATLVKSVSNTEPAFIKADPPELVC